MTPETLFTSRQPHSSGEYPGQSRLVAYFPERRRVGAPALELALAY